MEWCKEWGVKINVTKSGAMHIRNKKLKAERCEIKRWMVRKSNGLFVQILRLCGE